MHFGLPCVSTDCNYGPADLITDGKDGFLVPVNDQNALVKKMEQLISDTELQKTFSKNAIETTKNYTSDKVTSKWKSIINNHLS